MTEIINNGNVIAVRLKGDLDHHSVSTIRRELDSKLEISAPELLILDFDGVSFMDSSGIGLILGRMRIMKSLGGKIQIKNANDYISRLLRLAKLNDLIVHERKD